MTARTSVLAASSRAFAFDDLTTFCLSQRLEMSMTAHDFEPRPGFSKSDEKATSEFIYNNIYLGEPEPNAGALAKSRSEGPNKYWA